MGFLNRESLRQIGQHGPWPSETNVARAASALGLTIPANVLVQANEVIE
jgi:hypothetical protein